MNADDSLNASDHLPVQVVFKNPFVQPFRITSIHRNNEEVTLKWESVPGQRYAVEACFEFPGPVQWFALFSNLVDTNFVMTLETNLAPLTRFFRVRVD